MDTEFLVVVAISLCLLTGMIVVRLGTGGETTRRIVIAVVELWLAVALWIGAFWFLDAAGEGPGETSGAGDMGDAEAGFADLPLPTYVMGVLGLGLAVHLMWRLRGIAPRGVGP
jgi:hypothetical protein